MATTFQPLSTICEKWQQLPRLLVERAQYDDLLAVMTVLLVSVAYLSKGAVWDVSDPNRYKLFERPQQLLASSSAPPRSRDLVQLLRQASSHVAIIWASQSGTSERLAGRLANEANRRFAANALLLDVSDIDPASLTRLSESDLVIFLASTYGEGDPSDNLHEFWHWFKSEGPHVLSSLRFLAFGLGNSNYKHYNQVIDVLAKCLQDRGGQMLLRTGKADDANGETEEHYVEWKRAVFQLLQTSLHYQMRETNFEPSIKVVEDATLEPTSVCRGSPQVEKLTTKTSIVSALPIVASRELFKDTQDRSCLHLEFDLSKHAGLKYRTGDYLALWPVNPTDEVNRIIRLLGLGNKRAVPIVIHSLDAAASKVPSPTTPEALFQSYLAICASVSREHVASLAAFAPNKAAKRFVESISEHKDSYARYVSKTYVNFGRLLEAAADADGAWSQLPLSCVVDMLPALQPRQYSISSSSVVQSRQLSITAVVADVGLTGSRTGVPGVATNFLLNMRDGNHPRGLEYVQIPPAGHVYARICKSTFKLPATASAPIVMVGAGTGVAPFRAFVQERARLRSIGREIGTIKLFFGCRSPAKDFIYADEFAAFAKILDGYFSLSTAFSRPDVGPGRYVQDAILEEADEMCDLLLEQNAYFYICGSAAMARDVTTTIGNYLMLKQGWNEAELKAFSNAKKRQKRWMQDVWG